jgi:hypothetical protein
MTLVPFLFARHRRMRRYRNCDRHL